MNTTDLLMIGLFAVIAYLFYQQRQLMARLAPSESAAPVKPGKKKLPIRNWRYVSLATVLAVFFLMADSCAGSSTSVNQNDTNQNLSAHTTLLQQAQHDTGFTPLTHSQELDNLLRRLQRENDPNHISYFYAFSNQGTVLFYTPIKGKCSSTDSLPTAPDYSVSSDTANAAYGYSLAAPQLDGSYGANEPAIFCFTEPTDIMFEWSGQYFLSDAYIPLNSAPVLVLPTKTK